MFSPLPLDPPFEAVDNPRAIDSAVLNTIRLASSWSSTSACCSRPLRSSSALFHAPRRGRRQLMWMAVAAVVFVPLVVVAFIGAMTDSDAVTTVAAVGMAVLLPVGAGLAVSRYHLYDVDRILTRAVRYGVVWTLLIGAYVAVVVVLAHAFGQAVNRSPTATTLGTLVAAAAARPVYIAVRDAVDRRFLRRRYDALRQVHRVRRRPERSRRRVGLASRRCRMPTSGRYGTTTERAGSPRTVTSSTADPDARLVLRRRADGGHGHNTGRRRGDGQSRPEGGGARARERKPARGDRGPARGGAGVARADRASPARRTPTHRARPR